MHKFIPLTYLEYQQTNSFFVAFTVYTQLDPKWFDPFWHLIVLLPMIMQHTKNMVWNCICLFLTFCITSFNIVHFPLFILYNLAACAIMANNYTP